MPNPIRLLVVFVTLCMAAGSASAQRELVFAGIPWRITADSARTLLESRGFTFTRTGEDGDPLFGRDDGAILDTYV